MFPHRQCVVVGQWHLIIWSSPTHALCARAMWSTVRCRDGVCAGGWCVLFVVARHRVGTVLSNRRS